MISFAQSLDEYNLKLRPFKLFVADKHLSIYFSLRESLMELFDRHDVIYGIFTE